jgi:hypothetical protein
MHIGETGWLRTVGLAAAIAVVATAVSCVAEESSETGDEGDDGSGGQTAETGGASSGGTPSEGNGGSEATGGTQGADGAVACPTPTQALITDFTMAEDATDTEQITFGDFTTTFSGGTFVYPDTLTSDVTDGAWHVTGTVEDYTGLGFYFSVPSGKCGLVDVSAFNGISMTVSGTLPEGRSLKMWLGTAANTVSTAWYDAHAITGKDPGFGRCEPASDNEYDGTCGNAEALVDVSEFPTTVSLSWADFTGGTPETTPNLAEVTAFGFYVTWGGATDTPYEMDLTIDDLTFID